MMHALAIGHAGRDAATTVDGLWDAGYHSIMRVEDADDATAVLACFHPDLIVVLPDVAQSDSIATLRAVAKKAHAPVIVARADAERALDCLGPLISSGHVNEPSPRRTLHLALAA